MNTTVSIDIDIEVDDILWKMSDSEKEELCRELIRDGYGTDPEMENELPALSAETYTDTLLIKSMKAIWSNRFTIDTSTAEKLEEFLKENKIF